MYKGKALQLIKLSRKIVVQKKRQIGVYSLLYLNELTQSILDI